MQQAVLRLSFAEPLRYSRNEGYRTAEITFPFKVLAEFSTPKCGMVEPRGGAIGFHILFELQHVMTCRIRQWVSSL